MKKFSFLFFLMAVVLITLSSTTCTKLEDPKPVKLSNDTTFIDSTDTTGGGGGGGGTNPTPKCRNTRILVHYNSDIGPAAPGAKVYIALTWDSAVAKKHKYLGIADTAGIARFCLPTQGSVKFYFAYATYILNGDELETEGPKQLEVVPQNTEYREDVTVK